MQKIRSNRYLINVKQHLYRKDKHKHSYIIYQNKKEDNGICKNYKNKNKNLKK